MDRSVRLRALWRPITLAVAACASASIGHGQDPSWSLLRGGPDPTTRTSLILDLARQVPAERVLQRLKENPQAFRGSSGVSGRHPSRHPTAAMTLARSFRFSVVSPLGHGIRSLTLFGKPLMADDAEITVFRSSIP